MAHKTPDPISLSHVSDSTVGQIWDADLTGCLRRRMTRGPAKWHSGHQTRLADPHGFLAVTSLHWLSEQPQRSAAYTDLATWRPA